VAVESAPSSPEPAAEDSTVPPPEPHPGMALAVRHRKTEKSLDLDLNLKCMLCLIAKMDDQDPVDPEKTIEIGLKRKKFFMDMYCYKVLTLMHKTKSPKDLATLLEQAHEMKLFKVQRTSVDPT